MANNSSVVDKDISGSEHSLSNKDIINAMTEKDNEDAGDSISESLRNRDNQSLLSSETSNLSSNISTSDNALSVGDKKPLFRVEESLSIGDELQLYNEDEKELSIGDEKELSIGDEKELSIGDEKELSIGDEKELSIGDEKELSIGDEKELSIGDEKELSIGDEKELSIGDEKELSNGVEKELRNGDEKELSIGDEKVLGNQVEKELSISDKKPLLNVEESLSNGDENPTSIGDKKPLFNVEESLSNEVENPVSIGDKKPLLNVEESLSNGDENPTSNGDKKPLFNFEDPVGFLARHVKREVLDDSYSESLSNIESAFNDIIQNGVRNIKTEPSDDSTSMYNFPLPQIDRVTSLSGLDADWSHPSPRSGDKNHFSETRHAVTSLADDGVLPDGSNESKVAFLCTNCEKVFDHRRKYDLHSELRQCSGCQEWFPSACAIRMHQCEHPSCWKGRYGCVQCGAVFDRDTLLERHREKHAETDAKHGQRLECQFCQLRHYSRKYLRVHTSHHPKIGCTKCEIRFKNIAEFVKHCGENGTMCNSRLRRRVPKVTAKSAQEGQQPQNVKASKGPRRKDGTVTKGDACLRQKDATVTKGNCSRQKEATSGGASSSDKGSKAKKVRLDQANVEVTKEISVSGECSKEARRRKSTFKCGVCEKVFYAESKFMTHAKRRSCVGCKNWFATACLIRLHQFENPRCCRGRHLCVTCGAVFKSYPKLSDHRTKHVFSGKGKATQKRFKCNYCPFQHCSKVFMERHIKHHPKVGCPTCKEPFKNLKEFREHCLDGDTPICARKNQKTTPPKPRETNDSVIVLDETEDSDVGAVDDYTPTLDMKVEEDDDPLEPPTMDETTNSEMAYEDYFTMDPCLSNYPMVDDNLSLPMAYVQANGHPNFQMINGHPSFPMVPNQANGHPNLPMINGQPSFPMVHNQANGHPNLPMINGHPSFPMVPNQANFPMVPNQAAVGHPNFPMVANPDNFKMVPKRATFPVTARGFQPNIPPMVVANTEHSPMVPPKPAASFPVTASGFQPNIPPMVAAASEPDLPMVSTLSQFPAYVPSLDSDESPILLECTEVSRPSSKHWRTVRKNKNGEKSIAVVVTGQRYNKLINKLGLGQQSD